MKSLERAIGKAVRYKAVEEAVDLDALASQEGHQQRHSEERICCRGTLVRDILRAVMWDGEEKEREERFMDLWIL